MSPPETLHCLSPIFFLYIITSQHDQMEKANQRLKVLEHDLKKLNLQREEDDDSDDDDLDDREGLVAEIEELKKANTERQAKLDKYEKEKKWNVDNMFEVKDERTLVNPGAGELTYTDTGFVKPKDPELQPKKAEPVKPKSTTSTTAKPSSTSAKPAGPPARPSPPPKSSSSSTSTAVTKPVASPPPPKAELGVFETYHEFTEKYADVVEEFMAIPDLEGSKKFLLGHADILLQENCSNYLMLATLEDEMNGFRDKMKLVARQAQIVSNIAELAKTMRTHPGNVIMPFFQRLQERQYLEEFLKGVKDFQEKIIKRAVTKKAEMDAQRGQAEMETADGASKDLADIPKEQRLGPGGLDPLEVIETLPESMVKAFESRDVEQLKQALMQMDPKDAERHMDRCIKSGLWVAGA